jgi:8-amino-7-oxononanoate synthase
MTPPPVAGGPVDARLAERLADLDARQLRRRLRVVQGVDLSSNDYLGLAAHPDVRAALEAALHDGPHGAAGSRLISGHHPAFDELEAQVAAWQGTEAALCFSTGYALNVGTLSALAQRGDVLLSDALNHASLIDGARLSAAERVIVPHNDVVAWDRAMREARARVGAGGLVWAVVESVYSMDGDEAPLADLADLAHRHGVGLIVDEAHATGLFGPQGQGRVAALGLRGSVAATLHPCGKALGLAGGLVAGSAHLRDWLLQRARSFVFSTAPPPFLAAGLSAAIRCVQADPARRARPLALADRLRLALTGHVDTGASTTHIVPVIVGAAARALALEAALAGDGWHARAIRPPTVPEGTCRVRLVLRADLTEADVDRLAADLRRAVARLP